MSPSCIPNKCVVADFQRSYFWQLCNSSVPQRHNLEWYRFYHSCWVQADSASPLVPGRGFIRGTRRCYFWNQEQNIHAGTAETDFRICSDSRFPFLTSPSLTVSRLAAIALQDQFISSESFHGSVTANYYIKLYMAAICTQALLPQIRHASRWNLRHDSVLYFTAPRPV